LVSYASPKFFKRDKNVTNRFFCFGLFAFLVAA
jgi:hypothetical protein